MNDFNIQFEPGQRVAGVNDGLPVEGAIVRVIDDRWGQEITLINELPGALRGRPVTLRASQVQLVNEDT